MNIYYFAAHAPEPEMIKDLGAPITSRFKGDVSDIHRANNNCITFTETLYIGGQRIKSCYTIPANSIIVVEAPPLLQGDWLTAGIKTLLVPIRKQETNDKGRTAYKYCGLQQVKSIEVITSPWSNDHSSDDGNANVEKYQQPTTNINEQKPQTVSTTTISPISIFSFFGQKPKNVAV